jgi:uncharacterized protein YcsI (UPF0317 family)
MRSSKPEEVRRLCREGRFSGQTSGACEGFVQANLLVVPREYAFDFLLFCQRNPKPCPLIEVVEGSHSPRCAPGADLRTDLPGYRVRSNGALHETTDVATWWRDDLVSFLIGCSFSFEAALMAGGIRLRHVDEGRNVAMYRTSLACAGAGRFHGNMVVSMRPIHGRDVAKAVEISARFPHVHGAPIHVGDPAAIGVGDLAHPDFGEAVAIHKGEVPVFWACGVTPQVAAETSGIPFWISHSPGKMFVTDLREAT